MSEQLILRLFGGLAISKGEKLVTELVTQKADVLLAYLACKPRSHSREILATLLWDDRSQEQALSNLRTLLSNLRRHVKPYLLITRQTVTMDPDAAVWVDTIEFERMLAGDEWRSEGHQLDSPTVHQARTINHLEKALALYRGDFLEGIFLRESRGLEEWVWLMRERLRQQSLEVRQQLAGLYLYQRNYTRGISHAQRLVATDPLREDSHRLLMRLLARAGQHNNALAQYERCRKILATELGVEPAAETVLLYERIRRAKRPSRRQRPLPATPFVGREDELAVIGRRLDNPRCRLLTLVGTGGAGKTRLAQQVADDRRGDYLNGLFFLPLADVEAAALPGAIAATLGVTTVGKAPAQQQLLEYLQGQEMLLILDNFEHLVDEGAALLQAILEAAPDVQMLVTSRERLRLRAEWLVTVDGLPFPAENEKQPDSQTRSDYPAMQLFLTCAQPLQPGFSLVGDEEAAVSHICRLVEGLPLAIELAAASMAQYSATQVAPQIQHNLDFLATKMRDMPARHRSLRAVFEHSWSLLSKQERHIFSQLALFRGGFDPAAAGSVAGATAAHLKSLLAKSMLRRSGPERFDLHESLRQYAAEKLAAEAELATAARERHSTFYLEILARQERALQGRHMAQAMNTISVELENMRAAWRWAGEHGHVARMACGLAGLIAYHSFAGRAAEGEQLMSESLARLRSADDVEAARLVGRLLVGQARLLVELGRYEPAIAAVHAALDLAVSDPQTKAGGYFQWGRALWQKGNYEAAQVQLEQALSLAQAASTQGTLTSDILRTLGICFMHRGDFSQATIFYRQALEIDDAADNRRGQGSALNQLGRIASLKGELGEAQRYYEQVLAIFKEMEFRRGEGSGLINLGRTLSAQGEYVAAAATLQKALTLSREMNNRQQEALCLYNLGEIYESAGDFDAALSTVRQALDLSRRTAQRLSEGNSLWSLANIYFRQTLYEAAWQTVQEALGVYQAIKSPWGTGSSLHILGKIEQSWGNYEQAQRHFTEVEAFAESVASQHLLAALTVSQSLLLHQQSQDVPAYRQAQKALALAQQTGLQRLEAEAFLCSGHALAAQQETAAAYTAYQQALTLCLKLQLHHLAPAPLTGLAEVALAGGDTEQALAHVNEILAFLESHPLHGPDEPLRIYLSCYKVLQSQKESRAAGVLDAAHGLLQTQASAISDEGRRRSFLEKVVVHRKIVALRSPLAEPRTKP